MYSAIFERKSIRKYDQTPLPDSELASIQAEFSTLNPLLSDLNWKIEIVKAASVRNFLGGNAPYYLSFYSEEDRLSYENAGFVLQQLDLLLHLRGYGRCWMGAARPKTAAEEDLPFSVALAFGNPAEPLTRTAAQFKRKKLDAITDCADPRFEAVRLAPSARNIQPWFFSCREGKILVYRSQSSLLMRLAMPTLSRVDIGIALCHLWLASRRVNLPFNFFVEEGAPAKDGFEYVGTVSDQS
jgi:nitroreductase